MSDATIRLGYDDKDVASGLARTGAHVKRFESQTKGLFSGLGGALRGAFAGGLAALGTGSIISGFKQLIDKFDRVGDLAKQLDTSAESVQRLGMMAKLSGADVETIAKAMNRVNRQLAEGEGVDVFKKLGINIRDYMALDVDGQIIMLAEAFQRAQASGTGLAEAYDLFGKSAAELLPLLSSNTEALRKFASEEVVSDEQIAKIQDLNDEFDRLKEKTSRAAMSATVESVNNISRGWEYLLQLIREFDGEKGAVDAWLTEQAQGMLEKDQKKDDAQNEKEKRKEAAAATAEIKAGEQATRKEADECERSAKAHEEAARAAKQKADQAKRAADEAKREADTLNKARDARLGSIRDLETQMKILELRAKGRNKEADAVEREARIQEEAQRIAKETGVDMQKALEIARRKADLEDKIARNGERGAGGRRKIHGYSKEQRDMNPHLHGSRLDAYYADRQTPFFQKHQRTPNLDAHPWKRQPPAESKASQNMERKLDLIVENTAPLKDK